MTPILMDNNEEKIAFLKDIVNCQVTEERNGMFELSAEYPVSGPHFKDITVNRIIKAKPNAQDVNQMFRIYSVSKPINGTVTINAEHISYALSHYPLKKINLSNASATAAMNAILAEANNNNLAAHGFTFGGTDITTTAKFAVAAVSARAALGGTEGSIIDTYGGELAFNNKSISLRRNRGSNRGVRITYGKNMAEMKLEISTENSYTGIFPYAYDDNDTLITLTERVITVTNASGIPDRILLLDLSSSFEEDMTKDETNLRSLAQQYLANNDINAIDGSMTVSMVDMSKTKSAGYQAALETVGLCDTVKVINKIMNVSLNMKVIKTVYDVVSETYITLELGTPSSNLADTIKQLTRSSERNKKAIETGISQLAAEYTQAISDATAAITGASGGHVVLNPSLNPQEILILIDSDDVDEAQKLWRWNAAGLAYSSTGYNGTYSTSLLGADGKLVINNVTSQVISADLIRAGTLTSEDGYTSFDLDNDIISSEDEFGHRVKITPGEICFEHEDAGVVTDYYGIGFDIFEDETVYAGTNSAYGYRDGLCLFGNNIMIEGTLFTGTAWDRFAAVNHHRKTKYGPANINYNGTLLLGVGGYKNSPSIGFELYEDDDKTVRIDITQPLINQRVVNGALDYSAGAEIDIGFTARGLATRNLIIDSNGFEFPDAVYAKKYWRKISGNSYAEVTAAGGTVTTTPTGNTVIPSDFMDYFRNSDIVINPESVVTASAYSETLIEEDEGGNVTETVVTHPAVSETIPAGVDFDQSTTIPDVILDSDDSIDVYAMLALCWKGIKNLDDRVTTLEGGGNNA